MDNFHHKAIKRFNLEGIIQDESSIVRLREEYERLLVSEMRLNGYVPRLDINIDFTIDYNEIKNYFNFEITVYGTYTGKRKSKWIVGIDGSKPILIAKSKSRELLQEQV
jgi:hypothetical protein